MIRPIDGAYARTYHMRMPERTGDHPDIARVTMNIPWKVWRVVEEMADEDHITKTEAFRRCVSTEAFRRQIEQEGARLEVVRKDGKRERVHWQF